MNGAAVTTIFETSALLVMPFWVLMVLAPRAGVTLRVMRSPLVVLGPVLL